MFVLLKGIFISLLYVDGNRNVSASWLIMKFAGTHKVLIAINMDKHNNIKVDTS